MDEIAKNNMIALLDECCHNGKKGMGSLYAWFLSERPLIERTIQDAKETSEAEYDWDWERGTYE